MTLQPSISTDQPSGPVAPIVALAKDIKLSHSVFALPFALLATFLAARAAGSRLPTSLTIGLIIVCMVLARTVAMAFNRWADAKFDASNPRTAGRAIPSGKLSSHFVLTAIVICSVGFIAATSAFWFFFANVWPLVLSPFVLAWLCGYSYSKRFTWLCHLYVGSALAISPIAATIAVYPPALAGPVPWLLFGMVMCWVAGFDVIYALQDVAVDRAEGLYSMPSHLGVEPALWISRSLHAMCVACLVLICQFNPTLRHTFALGVGLTAGLLLLEHILVWRSKTHHIHVAFFTLNSIISVLLGTLGIVDLLMAG